MSQGRAKVTGSDVRKGKRRASAALPATTEEEPEKKRPKRASSKVAAKPVTVTEDDTNNAPTKSSSLTGMAFDGPPNWWKAIIGQSKQFLAELTKPAIQNALQKPVSGNYVNLPITPYIGLTPRFQYVMSENVIPVIQRQAFVDLQKHVQGKEGLTYVHGPQGFGKSFALYHLLCALSTDPNNRVLYIPDCSELNYAAFQTLYQAIVAAFAKDKDFLDDIVWLTHNEDASYWEQFGWKQLINKLKAYCTDKKLTFYAIFDQHNGLLGPQRLQVPTNLSNWPLSLNGKNFQIIISASANNDDQNMTKNYKDPYPFFNRLTDAELRAWQVQNAFFVDDPLVNELTELTGNIPYELSYMLHSMEKVALPTLAKVLVKYRSLRVVDMDQAHSKYLKDLPYNTIQHTSMLYMANKIPFAASTHLQFDKQLFYRTNDDDDDDDGRCYLRPCFPLALEMVLERLRPLDPFVLTKEIFEGPLTNDAKGRQAEHYIVHAITKRSKITLPLLSVGSQKLYRKLDISVAVEHLRQRASNGPH